MRERNLLSMHPELFRCIRLVGTAHTDPDPGSDALLIPGSGMGKNQDPDPGSGSGMNNPDHISESLKTIFLGQILKFIDAYPGWKKFGSGIKTHNTVLMTSQLPGSE